MAADYFCQSCRTPFLSRDQLNENDLCPVCSDGSINFDAVYTFGEYDGVLRQLIHLFKYSKVESLAHPLSQLLSRALPLDRTFDVISPMPMHWRKRWERGFNQAELLAEPIAKRLGQKLSTQLRRQRRTKAQAGLSEAQRSANLKNSFCVKNPEAIRGRRILLVDDVFTTGATLRAATEALKASGASHVSALVLARVDRRISNTSLKPPPRPGMLNPAIAASGGHFKSSN
jgi:ComF family protein